MNWQSSKVSWSNRSDSSARHNDVTSPGGRYTQTTTMDWWRPTILTLSYVAPPAIWDHTVLLVSRHSECALFEPQPDRLHSPTLEGWKAELTWIEAMSYFQRAFKMLKCLARFLFCMMFVFVSALCGESPHDLMHNAFWSSLTFFDHFHHSCFMAIINFIW